MADKMDAQITLTTSDDPPVSFTISRSALVAHSKVFADMLSLNLEPESPNPTIPLAETDYEIMTLLVIIEPKETDPHDALGQLDETMWIKLLQVADKYDCWHVMQVAQAWLWQSNEQSPHEESNEQSPELARFHFTIATFTGNEDLISHTAKRAVLIRDLKDPKFEAAHEWRERLAVWRTLRAARIPGLIDRYRATAPYHRDCESNFAEPCFGYDDGKGWDQLCRVAYEKNWMIAFRKHAAEFEKEISKWGTFPVKDVDYALKKESLQRLMKDRLIWKC